MLGGSQSVARKTDHLSVLSWRHMLADMAVCFQML